MAFNIKYFRLFEVRILHEYYLLAGADHIFYGLPETGRQEMLTKRVLGGQYKLLNDLDIVPTPSTAQLLRNQKLIFKKTATGFVVLSQGIPATLPISGTDGVLPFIPFGNEKELTFTLKPINQEFWNYSSLPIKKRALQDAAYFFSNTPSAVSGPGFASLSQPAEGFLAGSTYEPGDLAEIAGNLSEATATTTTNTDHWDLVESNGYINESDRFLLPKTFTYNVSAGASGLYSFSLRTPAAVVVKTIDFPNFNPPGPLKLDFSTVTDPVDFTKSPISTGFYDLEVATPGGTTVKRVFLSDEITVGAFGTVTIRSDITDPTYRILGDEGEMLDPHPVFEVRMKARRSFWNYRSLVAGKKLDPVGTAAFFEGATSGTLVDNLITKVPQKLTYLPSRIVDGIGNDEALPQPSPSLLRVKKAAELDIGEPPGRLLSDVGILTVNSKIKVGV